MTIGMRTGFIFRYRSAILVFLLGFLIGLGSLCSEVALSSLLKAAQAADTPATKAVAMGKAVARQELCDQLSYPARVLAKVSAKLLAEDDGVVGRILVPLGQSVRSGEPLLRLD